MTKFTVPLQGCVFDIAGHCAFPEVKEGHYSAIGLMNTKLMDELSKVINSTMHFQPGDFRKLPIPQNITWEEVNNLVKSAINISKEDWDNFEFSWDFLKSPLLTFSNDNSMSDVFRLYVENNERMVDELKSIENDILNKILVAFNLEYLESKYSISANEVTIFANPEYRYRGNVEKAEAFLRFQTDSFVEFISYSMGCMMGRYSLDREGVIYAHSANEGFKELVAEETYKTFPADDDGIVPLASEDWLFDDDATTRFKEFVKTVWGEEHLTENLEFVAESLCLNALKPVKGESANDTVRRYFSKQFFKDHCKTYKKRPIYWLFSSGKEKAFECLVYLHRYNEGTLSRMRTEYVTPLMGKFDAQHTLLSEQQIQATGTEARRIEKELKTLDKKQAELRTFDEQLKHYAEKRITLDLDDGVKANYGKFGNLLADVKAIHGKAVK